MQIPALLELTLLEEQRQAVNKYMSSGECCGKQNMVVVGGQGWVRVVAGAAAALLFCVCQGGFFDKVTTRK